MLEAIKTMDVAKGSVRKRPGTDGVMRLGGLFHVECRDRHGTLKWIEDAKNIMTDEGLNSVLDVMLHAATQLTTWYVAIFEDNHTPAAGDTYAVPGYTESTAYDEATRPEYEEAAASGKSITNSANKATFTINATKTIYGAALVGGGTDADTKGNTAGGGTLLCSAAFDSSKSVEDDDTLEVTYTLTAADA